MRKFPAVIAGIIAAGIIFYLFEYISSKMFPSPAGLDLNDVEGMKKYVSTLPPLAFIMILIGYVVGSFVCGVLVGKISNSDKKTLPLVAGTILTIAEVANLYAIPHPMWFLIISLLIFIPFTIVGDRIVKKKDKA